MPDADTGVGMDKPSVYVIKETKGGLDENGCSVDVETIIIDHGVFATREAAEFAVGLLEEPLRKFHALDESRRRERFHHIGYAGRSFEDYKRSYGSPSYEVVEVEVRDA